MDVVESFMDVVHEEYGENQWNASMNVMAWIGDLDKLEVLQNRIGHLALGTPKWMAIESSRRVLRCNLFSEGTIKAVLNYEVRIKLMEN
ncbi:hypothetical protein FHG87_025474 [Trinorchestia longiramus]|nr:hypothetical protein FHG87_025474 [Trinorchestia longiramus]